MTSIAKAIPAAVVAFACAIGAVYAESARVETEDGASLSVASPSASALGLHVGDLIAGWRVVAIAGAPDSELRIDVARDDMRFAVTVVPMGARPENPPMQTRTHAIYYGHALPAEARIPDGAVRAILADIVRRLDAES